MPLGTTVDLSPGHIVLDGDPVPLQNGHSSPPPLFGLRLLWPWLHISAKGRERKRKSIYTVPFRTKVHTKRSGMDHTVLAANNTMTAFPS